MKKLIMLAISVHASLLSMDKTNVKIAILVSGNGTNMAAILDAIQNQQITNAQACVIISNKEDAPALEKARVRKIPTEYIPNEIKEYSQALIDCLKKYDITPENGLICLAGFIKILKPKFVTTFKNRILNIHPSLLPKFPGGHAIQNAFDAKETKTGVTVHLVDEGVDTGQILEQVKVNIESNDTLDTLTSRIHDAEHQLYPRVIDNFIRSNIKNS